jgi:hypothetical protein
MEGKADEPQQVSVDSGVNLKVLQKTVKDTLKIDAAFDRIQL